LLGALWCASVPTHLTFTEAATPRPLASYVHSTKPQTGCTLHAAVFVLHARISKRTRHCQRALSGPKDRKEKIPTYRRGHSVELSSKRSRERHFTGVCGEPTWEVGESLAARGRVIGGLWSRRGLTSTRKRVVFRRPQGRKSQLLQPATQRILVRHDHCGRGLVSNGRNVAISQSQFKVC
jgi:hypothetical protein